MTSIFYFVSHKKTFDVKILSEFGELLGIMANILDACESYTRESIVFYIRKVGQVLVKYLPSGKKKERMRIDCIRIRGIMNSFFSLLYINKITYLQKLALKMVKICLDQTRILKMK